MKSYKFYDTEEHLFENFIRTIFLDSVHVDKVAAILYLKNSGYTLIDKEVQGISQDYVTEVIKNNPTQVIQPSLQEALPCSNDKNNQTADTIPTENLNSETSTRSIIYVDDSLISGKQPRAIYKVMHEAEYSDDIIAHVIRKKHTNTINKTNLGKLFFKKTADKKTYRNKATKLLDEASNKEIVISPKTAN